MPGARLQPTVRPVVFVDGVRTPFGQARADGLYAHTRADDLAVKTVAMLRAPGGPHGGRPPRPLPHGGAIAVGHPLASSGVRLMTQLARHFAARPDVRYGLTTLCVGLGQGASVIWENPHHAADEGPPPATGTHAASAPPTTTTAGADR